MRSLALTFTAVAFATGAALAQQPKSDDHSAHHPATSAASDMTAGEVRKVDKEAGKLTLKHEEIKNLDMPGMTMVFAVKDKAMLDKVQPGDKVRFKAEKGASGLTVTAIEAAP